MKISLSVGPFIFKNRHRPCLPRPFSNLWPCSPSSLKLTLIRWHCLFYSVLCGSLFWDTVVKYFLPSFKCWYCIRLWPRTFFSFCSLFLGHLIYSHGFYYLLNENPWLTQASLGSFRSLCLTAFYLFLLGCGPRCHNCNKHDQNEFIISLSKTFCMFPSKTSQSDLYSLHSANTMILWNKDFSILFFRFSFYLGYSAKFLGTWGLPSKGSYLLCNKPGLGECDGNLLAVFVWCVDKIQTLCCVYLDTPSLRVFCSHTHTTPHSSSWLSHPRHSEPVSAIKALCSFPVWTRSWYQFVSQAK